MAELDYDRFSVSDRIQLAEEMAGELRDKSSRACAPAMTICDMLKPDGDADSPHDQAWRLAEVLEEMMADCAQEYRLEGCLKSLRSAITGQQSAA